MVNMLTSAPTDYWWVLILLIIVYYYVNARKKSNYSSTQSGTENSPADSDNLNQETSVRDYSKKYQRRLLLTKNEYSEWKKLKTYADNKGYIICPKVRLLDLLEPRRGEKDYMSLLGKIQSKHVDFVICDQQLYVKGVVELDDNSHNQTDRQKRDAFVDEILSAVGYKVVHTRSITETTLDSFCSDSNVASEAAEYIGTVHSDVSH